LPGARIAPKSQNGHPPVLSVFPGSR